MEDSARMTIEFLRARLLSERSVSRVARQKADQQTKRVMELEEKLRFTSVQRKKAERAAAEVLSILKSRGIRDLSEEMDSSSEEEDILSDQKLKEYESSTVSRLERSEVEIELSGSESEISNSQGKSLSWKSHSKSPDSGKNQISKELRQRQRQRFFSTLQSSPKPRSGKSCRRIKPRDIDLEADSEKYACGECSSNCDSRHDEYRDDHNEQSGEDKVMERVLDHQAELIGQFQAEEIAQRDWEDKFNENVSSVDHETTTKSSLTAATNNSLAKEFELAEDYYNDAKEVSATELPPCVEALSTSKEPEDIHGTIRNKLQNEVAHHGETSNKLGDVLEALRMAKLSLSGEFNKLPSSDENTKTMSAAALDIGIPIDSASLFRLPTDTFPDELLSMPKFSVRGLNLPSDRPATPYF